MFKLTKRKIILGFATLLIALPGLNAANPTASGTGHLALTVSPEAYLVATSDVALTNSGTDFSQPWTGSNNLTVKLRTEKASGGAAITAQVTTDFNTGGPSAASPLRPEDALKCSGSSSVTGATALANQTIQGPTGAATSVVTFGPDVHTSNAGDAVTLTWSMGNDTNYKTGTYTATVTYTVSIT